MCGEALLWEVLEHAHLDALALVEEDLDALWGELLEGLALGPDLLGDGLEELLVVEALGAGEGFEVGLLG